MGGNTREAFLLLLTISQSSYNKPVKRLQLGNILNLDSNILTELTSRNLIESTQDQIWITSTGQNFIDNLLTIPLPNILNEQPDDQAIDIVDENLIKLIEQIDKEEYCAGLVPLDLLGPQAEKKLNLNITLLHKRLKNLEQLQKIYLETINDSSRLVGNQRAFALDDVNRGILFYVGRP